MTNPLINPLVQAFCHDLDENIVFKEVHEGVTENGTEFQDIVLDFVNPVTGSVDQVQFEVACNQVEMRIFYIVDSNKDKIHEELQMEDLNDLYDFILIEEEVETDK